MKKSTITTEAREAMNRDIFNTSAARQRAAKSAYEWAYNPNNWNTCTDIYDAYDRPSRAKVNAFTYCKQLCNDRDGFDFCIIGHNTSTFSVGFKYYGKETGALCFAYITRDYDSYCFA